MTRVISRPGKPSTRMIQLLVRFVLPQRKSMRTAGHPPAASTDFPDMPLASALYRLRRPLSDANGRKTPNSMPSIPSASTIDKPGLASPDILLTCKRPERPASRTLSTLCLVIRISPKRIPIRPYLQKTPGEFRRLKSHDYLPDEDNGGNGEMARNGRRVVGEKFSSYPLGQLIGTQIGNCTHRTIP